MYAKLVKVQKHAQEHKHKHVGGVKVKASKQSDKVLSWSNKFVETVMAKARR